MPAAKGFPSPHPPPDGCKTSQSAHLTLSSTPLSVMSKEGFCELCATSQPCSARGERKSGSESRTGNPNTSRKISPLASGEAAPSRAFALVSRRPDRPGAPEKPHFGAAPGGSASSAKHHRHRSRKRSPLGFPGEIPNPGRYLAESMALQRHCRSPENAHLFPVSCCSAQVPTGDWRPPNCLTSCLHDGKKYRSASVHHQGVCGNRSGGFSRKTSPHDAITARSAPENAHQTSDQARKLC